MSLKAIFKVNNLITKVDKPIPFTNEVIKAGTEGSLHGYKHSTYILRFSKDFINFLYLEYKVSELDIQGELESILIEERKPL